MVRVSEIIYNIPCCGGFCAPTKNPDHTCFRHVSNEYTVPLAGRFHKLLCLLETNFFCRTCGRTGLAWGDRYRKHIGVFLAALNGFALVMGLVAALGMTTMNGLLKQTYWVHGSFKIASVPDAAIGSVFPNKGAAADATIGVPFDVYIGVNMRLNVMDCRKSLNVSLCSEWLEQAEYIKDEVGMHELRILWNDEDACQRGVGLLSEERLQGQKLCRDCRDAQFANFALVMGVVTQFPTLLTNLQRSTRFGDVNCQATMGVLTNIWGFIMTMLSVLLFKQACHGRLPETVGGVRVDWKLGGGFWCLVFATLVKVPDGIGHFLIPTPTQRWKTPDWKISHASEYMMLQEESASPKQVHMKPGMGPTLKGDVPGRRDAW